MKKDIKTELKADLWDAFRLIALILGLIVFFVTLIIYFPF